MAKIIEGDFEKDEEFEENLDAISSGRGKLRRKMQEQNPEFAKVFEEQTPEQRAWGKLIGKLILSKSNDDVESAFDWFSEEIKGDGEKIDLTYAQKMVAMFHAIGSLGIDAAHYRILRQMYVKANAAQ